MRLRIIQILILALTTSGISFQQTTLSITSIPAISISDVFAKKHNRRRQNRAHKNKSRKVQAHKVQPQNRGSQPDDIATILARDIRR